MCDICAGKAIIDPRTLCSGCRGKRRYDVPAATSAKIDTFLRPLKGRLQ